MWLVMSSIVWSKVALATMANSNIVKVIAIMAIAAIAIQILRPKLITPFLMIRSSVIKRWELCILGTSILAGGAVGNDFAVVDCYNSAAQLINNFLVMGRQKNGSAKKVDCRLIGN